jgi:hypothetical protein
MWGGYRSRRRHLHIELPQRRGPGCPGGVNKRQHSQPPASRQLVRPTHRWALGFLTPAVAAQWLQRTSLDQSSPFHRPFEP